MKFYFFTLIASTIVLVSSCSKEKNEKNEPVPTIVTVEKPKKLLVSSGFLKNYLATFEYNADSTLHKWKMERDGFTPEVSFYTYNGNTIIQESYRNVYKVSEGTATMENARLVKERFVSFNGNGEINQDVMIGCEYDALGRLSKWKWGIDFARIYTYNANNDVISRKDYTGDVFTGMREFTYTNIVDKYPWYGPLTIDRWSYQKPAFSAHLVKRVKVTDANGALKEDYEYDYQLDADGYVIGGTEYDHVLNSSRQWTNVYQ